MTVLTVVVGRDASGRLHGTIERDDPDPASVAFTGVIELVALIEAALEVPDGDPGLGTGPNETGPPSAR